MIQAREKVNIPEDDLEDIVHECSKKYDYILVKEEDLHFNREKGSSTKRVILKRIVEKK